MMPSVQHNMTLNRMSSNYYCERCECLPALPQRMTKCDASDIVKGGGNVTVSRVLKSTTADLYYIRLARCSSYLRALLYLTLGSKAQTGRSIK